MRIYTCLIHASLVALAINGLALADTDNAKAERDALRAEIEELKKSSGSQNDSSPFTFGGYGEIHYNETEGTGGDFTDIHRFVLYMGYRFADWIQLDSEIELEHAFVATGKGGEFKLEQLKVDFMLTDAANIRVGRMLAPIGIINETHEPTTFNGVERPNFSKQIIPSTWSLEGIGVFGNVAGVASYQLNITSSLDGSKISGSGIRSARQHERPGTHQLATTARVEYIGTENLKVGVSYFQGGVNNANKGKSPGIDDSVSVAITAVDLQYSYSIVDFRAVQATTTINNADKLNEYFSTACEADSECNSATVVPEGLGGYYAELGVHVLPESMTSGKLKDSDLILFARHEAYNLNSTPAKGVDEDKSKDITELTYGLSFFPVENLVVKLDKQEMNDASDDSDYPSRFNLGIGWHF